MVVVGRLGRPHGVQGGIHAHPTGPTLGSIPVGARVVARRRGVARELVVQERIGTADKPVLHFAGVTDRDAAKEIAGLDLLVPASLLPPPPEDPDTFYVRDLIGCEVFAGDAPLGRVRDVHPGPANDSLDVEGEGGRVLLPFTGDALVELDVAGRRIVVRPDLLPEGDGA